MAFLSQYSTTGLPYSFRNKIINGAMLVDQRNNYEIVTAAGIASTRYPCDGWLLKVGENASLSVTGYSFADAPAGFTRSILLNNNQSVTLTTGQLGCFIGQTIEDGVISDLLYGGSRAQPVTISFWVKASIAGLYVLNWNYNIEGSSDRADYKTTYRVNTVNSWEYKTITIPGNTLYKNRRGQNAGAGANLQFVLGTGRTDSLLNQWTLNNDNIGTTGTANFLGTVNATFQVTGVQAEIKGTATPFEWRPYGLEFNLCQRYYNQPNAYYQVASGSAPLSATYLFPVAMARTPTVSAEKVNSVDLVTPYSARIRISSAEGLVNRLISLDAEL